MCPLNPKINIFQCCLHADYTEISYELARAVTHELRFLFFAPIYHHQPKATPIIYYEAECKEDCPRREDEQKAPGTTCSCLDDVREEIEKEMTELISIFRKRFEEVTNSVKDNNRDSK